MVSGHTHQAYNCVLSAQKELIGRYRTLLGPVAAEEVGETSAPITRIGVPSGETPLGNLIADAQLSATDDEQGAVAAFMNPGGVRADLDAGPVTYEEALHRPAVRQLPDHTRSDRRQAGLPAGTAVRHRAEVAALSHRALHRAPGGDAGHSRGSVCGHKVDEIVLGDVPVDPAATYRITVNSFLAGGGDGFST